MNDELIRLWTVALHARGNRPRGIKRYQQHVQQFEQWHGGELLRVTTNEIRQWIDDCASHLKPPTIANALTALRSFYGWAVERELIAQSPADHILSLIHISEPTRH